MVGDGPGLVVAVMVGKRPGTTAIVLITEVVVFGLMVMWVECVVVREVASSG